MELILPLSKSFKRIYKEPLKKELCIENLENFFQKYYEIFQAEQKMKRSADRYLEYMIKIIKEKLSSLSHEEIIKLFKKLFEKIINYPICYYSIFFQIFTKNLCSDGIDSLIGTNIINRINEINKKIIHYCIFGVVCLKI